MTDLKMTKKVAKEIMNSMKIEPILNRKGDLLPFGLFYPPSEGFFTWHCGEDEDGKVTSVYKVTPGNDKRCEYITYERACDVRNILKAEGWRPIVPPKVALTHPDTKRPLTRAEKKRVARQIAKMSKKAVATGAVDTTADLGSDPHRWKKGPA